MSEYIDFPTREACALAQLNSLITDSLNSTSSIQTNAVINKCQQLIVERLCVLVLDASQKAGVKGSVDQTANKAGAATSSESSSSSTNTSSMPASTTTPSVSGASSKNLI
ncbi:MAG: hypothetical protein EOO38_13460 [Cytophagaceae bacterium]|nr:MAG: hypothetical protein EOO38_13460 [Cytophagaceae bacterium]